MQLGADADVVLVETVASEVAFREVTAHARVQVGVAQKAGVVAQKDAVSAGERRELGLLAYFKCGALPERDSATR
jgi:translation initiation factor 2 alpha subunit (eIF-2alpha)